MFFSGIKIDSLGDEQNSKLKTTRAHTLTGLFRAHTHGSHAHTQLLHTHIHKNVIKLLLLDIHVSLKLLDVQIHIYTQMCVCVVLTLKSVCMYVFCNMSEKGNLRCR